MLIDSHCHFDFEVFDADRASIWSSCKQAGVDALVIPAVEPGRLVKLFSIADTFSGIYGSAGLHPWWVESWLKNNAGQSLAVQLEPYLGHSKCVAVGECGLDGAIDTPMEPQLALFEQQLQLANDLEQPVIVHVRKAHNEVLPLLKKIRPGSGGVIHGFSGSAELAQSYWQLGFRLGVGGTITYERARKTRQAVAALPLEALLLETDAPDMPIDGRQGVANSPGYLPDIARCLSELRGQALSEITRQTSENCVELFGLSFP